MDVFYVDWCLKKLGIKNKRYAGNHDIKFKIERLEMLIDQKENQLHKIKKCEEEIERLKPFLSDARKQLRMSEQGKSYLKNRRKLIKQYE